MNLQLICKVITECGCKCTKQVLKKIRFDVGSPSFISDKLNIGSNATATTTLMVSGDVKTTGQAYFADTTLSFDATQDWNVSANQVCTLTLTANTTFDAPTNMVDGAFYSILMIQDGTGFKNSIMEHCI